MAMLLHRAGYSLQSNRKVREGTSHPDRNAQFEHINAKSSHFQRRGQPVDLGGHEKEGIGREFQEWRAGMAAAGEPEEVHVHDFQDPELGKAIPYGVYDLTQNQGWVSVGIDHDTAQFAASSHPSLVEEDGAKRFPEPSELLITADGGGSNSRDAVCGKWPCRIWRTRLGLEVAGLSFSAWNQQMEQDRTSSLLPHHTKLEGKAAH